MTKLNKLFLFITNKQVHVSWLIAWSGLGILIGIILIRVLPHEAYRNTSWLIITLALFAIAYIKRSTGSIILSCLAGIALGLYAGAGTINSIEQYQSYYGESYTINGVIRDDVTTGESSNQRMRLTQVSVKDQNLGGLVWVSTDAQTELRRGDHITVEGTMLEGFGTAHSSVHDAELIKVTRPQPGDVALSAREDFSQKVKLFVAESHANLGISFLIGQRTTLSEGTQSVFRDLGLIHLVVASGFHLTIVVRYSRRLLIKQSKYLATAICLFMIGGFLLLTGFSTSMIRASIVATLSLLAWYVGRAIHPIVLLLVVAAITALINPVYVWSDLAWHLSFAAFTGVIILAPLLQKYFWHPNKEPGFIRYVTITTLSAQLMTFPIIAMAFEQYSPIALLSNLLVLPFVPFIMLGTFLVGISGYVLPTVAEAVSVPTEFGLRYIQAITDYLSSLSWSTSSINVNPPTVLTMYVALFILMIYLQRKTGHSLRSENPIE